MTGSPRALKVLRRLGLLLWALSRAHGAASAPPAPHTVVTACGTYLGSPVSTQPNVTAFRGIAYAAPPVRDLRWAAPQAPRCRAGESISAKHNAAVCPQKGWLTEMVQHPYKHLLALAAILLLLGAMLPLLAWPALWRCLGRVCGAGSGEAATEGERRPLMGDEAGLPADADMRQAQAASCSWSFCCGIVGAALAIVGAVLLVFTLAQADAYHLFETVGNEDCLYLNVYVAESVVDQPGDRPLLPVMVYLHPGGFRFGTGMDADGGSSVSFGGTWALARAGEAVSVQFNYRLGALGFLNLLDSNGDPVFPNSANLGLRDQIAALEWVQANIASFGGDPQQVTIWGEGSGGSSVLALLSSPLAKGLFQRAWSSSGSVHVGGTLQTSAAAWRTKFLSRFTDCRVLKGAARIRNCLRSKHMRELVANMPDAGEEAWDYLMPQKSEMDETHEHIFPLLVVDGDLLPGSPITVLRHAPPDVAVVIGAMQEEFDAYTPAGADGLVPFTPNAVDNYLASLRLKSSSLYRLYAPGETSDLDAIPDRRSVDQLIADTRFICANHELVDALRTSPNRTAPVYEYIFAVGPSSPLMLYGISTEPTMVYAGQGWATLLLLGANEGYTNVNYFPAYGFTDGDKALGHRIRRDMLDFATSDRTPQFDKHGTCLVHNSGNKCSANPRRARCEELIGLGVSSPLTWQKN